MKQSALVIATLFAVVEAEHHTAKQRMERDIKGYLHNGLKFDTKVIKAVHANAVRVNKLENNFKEEARNNWDAGYGVADQYVDAIKYEKSQETYTAPTAANYQWGNLHYSNPQKIMDKYVAAAQADQKLGEEWREDIHEYAHGVQRSHEKMGNQIDRAWETNGVKAHHYGQAALRNAGEALNQPHSLAVDSVGVKEDAENYFEAIGDAAHAVSHTMRTAERADRIPNRNIDRANYKYIQEREQIAKGYNKAIEFEINNTHFNAGKPGGEGRLDWTHKQQIVNKWAAPIEANEKATQQWQNTVQKNMAEKHAIHQAAKAEAQKVWPAKFEAVQKAWTELADNFDGQPQESEAERVAEMKNEKAKQEGPPRPMVPKAPHAPPAPHAIPAPHAPPAPHRPFSLATRAETEAGLRNIYNNEWALNKSVIDDVVHFNNDTIAQQKTFKSEVATYIEQKKVINQQYAEAFNYEMENIHFANNQGKWSFTVDNKETILDKWTTAQANDIEARQELKEDFINANNSIRAQKAAFKATAQAQWPQKFQAYKQAIIDFDQAQNGPANRADMHPSNVALITDAQQTEAELIRGQVYDNMNERYAFKYEVKKDLKAYFENTNGARDALKADVQDWKAAGKRVQDMYAAAWNYQIAETKFTPASATGPAHVELQNPVKVSNNYRAAAQADQDLGNNIKDDIAHFNQAITPARNVLKNEINSQWVPAAEAINKSDVQIFEEVVNFPQNDTQQHMDAYHGHFKNATAGINGPQVHAPFAHLMAVESSSNLTLNEQLAYGSVFLMAMIAVAALSNKGKAESKTVEFDVEDLEMTNKKESKKQIKKTLKDIMKTSNTKVTLM